MNRIAYLVLWLLILALLGFTAIRTVHLLSLTFPADQQEMKWLGLAAFDGGALGWYVFFKYSARGWQRAFSFLMVFACLSGVCLCTYADTFLVSSENGLVRLPASLADTAVVGVIIIILLNVCASFITHMVAPEALRQWKVEAAHDKIEAETLRSIESGSLLIAPDISKQLGAQWQSQTYRDLGLDVPAELPQIAPPPKKKAFWKKTPEEVESEPTTR